VYVKDIEIPRLEDINLTRENRRNQIVILPVKIMLNNEGHNEFQEIYTTGSTRI
jgi:hypothetical protein